MLFSQLTCCTYQFNLPITNIHSRHFELQAQCYGSLWSVNRHSLHSTTNILVKVLIYLRDRAVNLNLELSVLVFYKCIVRSILYVYCITCLMKHAFLIYNIVYGRSPYTYMVYLFILEKT